MEKLLGQCIGRIEGKKGENRRKKWRRKVKKGKNGGKKVQRKNVVNENGTQVGWLRDRILKIS